MKGETYDQLVRRQREERAIFLRNALRGANYRIKGAAYDIGVDESYFSCTFIRLNGMSVRDWKKEHREKG